MKPAMTPQQKALADSGSALAAYKEFAVGKERSLFSFVWYEILTTLFSSCSGILGLGIRSILYPSIFSKCGKRPAIGRGVVIRRPGSISLGSRILIDDYAVLDVRGEKGSISLGDYVSLGRFTTLSSKDGDISLGSGVNVGSYCRIATQSKVHIGESTLIAAYCYIGPGNHTQGDSDTPLIEREMEIKGGVNIGAHSWIGARTTILDGVTIGEGAIIGAHSLVLTDIPQRCVAVGVPAKVVKQL